MFKRKMMATLVDWKNNHNTECLLVNGARRVGKTTLLREFAKQNYKHCIELNYLSDPRVKNLFNCNLTSKELINKLKSDYLDIEFKKGEVLLFLDDIQECNHVLAILSLVRESGVFDCIACGSMLETKLNLVPTDSLSWISVIQMYSLDFEEFLWAKGLDETMLGYVKEYFDNKSKVDRSINDTMNNYLKEYLIVGGMPQVVETYLNTNIFSTVHQAQLDILSLYSSHLNEIKSSNKDADKIKACYLSLVSQLKKENKKFQYSLIEKNASARKYKTSLEYLISANLIRLYHNVADRGSSLASNEKRDYFKAYCTDIGLLGAMHGYQLKSDIYYNKLHGRMKTTIYESFIADTLLKKNIPLRYFKPKNNRQEIEFLITDNSKIIPIEVKSGNASTTSLREYMKQNNPPYAYKFIDGNLSITNNIISLPLYMMLFI
jgi:predicted AAA+ superfamily ATPase